MMAEDPVERAQTYLAGFAGENDLSVGPNMLAWALEDLLRHHLALFPAESRANSPSGEDASASALPPDEPQ
jgi:hypothetical protein